MSIYYQYNQQQIIVQGQTYTQREAIKALGGRFLGERKLWRLAYSPETLQKIALLCRSAGGGQLGASKGAEEPALPPPLRRLEPLEQAGEGLLEISEKKEEEVAVAGQPGQAVAGEKQLEGLSVSQLLQQAQACLQRGFPNAVWVYGEMQNVQERGRLLFFDLAEGDRGKSQQGTLTIKSVLWPSTRELLERHHGSDKVKAVLQDGLRVRLLCQVQLYQGRGQLSLQVINLDPLFTQGALALARIELLKELRRKGLDTANKQKRLSLLPFKVGLLSAPGSRAESDFLHQLSSGGFPGSVSFVPCSMQGEKVAAELSAGIRRLVAAKVAVIVITRGGGSAADLRWFDGPEVAYAIAGCSIPVVAAIGHHDDRSVAEDVSYQRCKTPTAAADFINEIFQGVRWRLEQAASSLQNRLQGSLAAFDQRQNLALNRLGLAVHRQLAKRTERLGQLNLQWERSCGQKLHSWDQALRSFAEQLPRQAYKCLHRLEAHFYSQVSSSLPRATEQALHSQSLLLTSLQGTLAAKDPSPWLEQGWTRLETASGPLRSVRGCEAGAVLTARLSDGSVQLTVKKLIPTGQIQQKGNKEDECKQ